MIHTKFLNIQIPIKSLPIKFEEKIITGEHQTKNIYIDGNNFLFGLRSIKSKYNDFNFDFLKFIHKRIPQGELNQIYYYSAMFQYSKNPQIYLKQKKFFKRLKKDNIIVRTSTISSVSNRVKGDDIYLAVDMMDDACQGNFETAILVSGDGDFLPLVERVLSFNKNVELWAFKGSTSQKLQTICSTYNLINWDSIKGCGYKQNQPKKRSTK